MTAVVTAASALLASGCSSQSVTAAGSSLVRVSERDFHISAPKRAPAGDVRFLVRNKGPDDHELIVVRGGDRHLPLRNDNVTADEEVLKRSTVGVLEAGTPGSVREMRLHLRPGRYELICNMYGHYLGGMHAALTIHKE